MEQKRRWAGAAARRKLTWWIVSWLVLAAPLRAEYAGPVPAPTDRFGRPGEYAVEANELPSPEWGGQVVTVFRPVGAEGARPVWWLAHGFAGTQPEFYRELIDHLVGHGAWVIFSPYPANLRVRENYDIMFAGYEAAVARYGAGMDLSRLGVIGHSYGGGAVPALARRAVVERGWGGTGLALLQLAPWFTHAMSDEELADLPAHTQFVAQVYEDDTMNDHRMAIDIFEHMPVAATAKAFLLLRSDRIDGFNYDASHNVPTGVAVPRPGAGYNALDAWGVARIAQALGASAWHGDAEARALVFGDGGDGTIEMGMAKGRPLRPMERWADPAPLFPMSHYLNPWSGWLNPRYRALPRPTRTRLSNLSVRAYSGTGDEVLVTGATVSGGRPKTLLARVVGPGLRDFGVEGVMQDPTLAIMRDAARDLMLNDWEETPSVDALKVSQDEVGAFGLVEGSADAAIQASFAPGSLTVLAEAGTGTPPGVVLVELYDVEEAAEVLMSNLSVRGRAGAGDHRLVVGFVIAGEASLKLLVRGVGPGLAEFGVDGTLRDPQLRVFRDGEELAANDDWTGDEIVNAAARVGAFPLVAGSRDAGLLLHLGSGAYTVHLQGSGTGDEGIGLVELYVLD